MLRFANVMGPRIKTAMTDYFSLPVLPVPLGFDARLQFVHEEDVTAACSWRSPVRRCRSSTSPETACITVSPGRRHGRASHGRVPFAISMLGALIRRAGLADFSSDQLSFLSYGRGLDTTRMRTVMKFSPGGTPRAAFRDFADHAPPVVPGADTAMDLLGQGRR
jgi:UDP-glucose 4-epimerase